jgi:GMP synthase-like glutamine amidotransferase
MKPIRIFRHQVCEGPGYLGHFLDLEGVPWRMVCLDERIEVPMDLDDLSALVFMGGNMSVNDPLEWIARELELIRRAHERGIPMMGVCFGGQLISKALGGRVKPSHQGMEVGWHNMQRVRDCAEPEWLEGLPEDILTFHWHGETFDPPPGSTLLLENRCFPNQAFALGDNLGMQFHLEMTARMIFGWISEYGRNLDPDDHCIQTMAEITDNLGEKIGRLHQSADRIFGHWLERVRRRAAADGQAG